VRLLLPPVPLWLYLRAVQHLAMVATILQAPCPYPVPVVKGRGDG